MNQPRVEVYPRERATGELGGAVIVPEWRWRLRGANGEIVCSGEAHGSRRDAVRAAERAGEILAEKPDVVTVEK